VLADAEHIKTGLVGALQGGEDLGASRPARAATQHVVHGAPAVLQAPRAGK
jgi:hypothetical protein